MRPSLVFCLVLVAACDRDTTPPVYAPNTNSGPVDGVGVIDVDPNRAPYLVGPNPAVANTLRRRSDEVATRIARRARCADSRCALGRRAAPYFHRPGIVNPVKYRLTPVDRVLRSDP